MIERPKTVPDNAIWQEKDERWELAPLVAGKKHGPAKWFRKDGTLECDLVYANGVEDGPYTRYHQNGERSQWGTMKNDLRHGVCAWQRSNGETTENTIPDAVNAKVKRSEQEFFEDGTCSLARYFDAEGREVEMSGEPMPKRPDGLEPFSDRIESYQVDVAYPMTLGFEKTDADSRKISIWESGRMKPNTGARVGTWRFYWSDGTLMEEVDYGKEGTETRTRRLFDPKGRLRVEGAYAYGDRRYPGGGRKPGRPTGVWRFYDDSGEMIVERDITPHDFERVEEGEMDEAILAFAKVAKYDVPDGAVYRATRDLFRIEEEGSARAFATHEDGTRKAEGAVRVQTIEGKSRPKEIPVAPWRFFDRKGALITEIDPTLPEWKDSASLEGLHKLHCYAAARHLPKSDVEAMAAAHPWEDLEWCWSAIAKHARFLVHALVAEDHALRNSAWGYLADHTYHQGSIYTGSAALTPILLRLVEDPRANGVDHLRLLSWYAESLMETAHYYDMDGDTFAACVASPPSGESETEETDEEEDDEERAAPPGWLVFMMQAFRKEAPLFARLITHEDERTRTLAGKIIASGVVGAPKEITAALGGALERATEPVEIAKLITGLRPLAQAAADLLRPYYEDTKRPALVRYAAALVAIEAVMRSEDRPPPLATSCLVALVREAPSDLVDGYDDVPALAGEGHFAANAGVTLASTLVRHDVASELVPPLLKMLTTARVFDAMSLASALLKLTQPRTPADAEREEVVGLRRKVLEAIIALDGDIWTWVNFREVLDAYGLPTAFDADGAKKGLSSFARGERPFVMVEDDDEEEDE
jgi:hypothetical protein